VSLIDTQLYCTFTYTLILRTYISLLIMQISLRVLDSRGRREASSLILIAQRKFLALRRTAKEQKAHCEWSVGPTMYSFALSNNTQYSPFPRLYMILPLCLLLYFALNCQELGNQTQFSVRYARSTFLRLLIILS